MAKPTSKHTKNPSYLGIFFKWIFALLLLFLITIAGAALWIYYHQDKIVALFLARANPYLQAKIETGKIEVEFIKSFPNASLVFNNIVIYEPSKADSSTSINGVPKKLASLEKLSIAFDILKLYNGLYEVEKIALLNGFVQLRTLADGSPNWVIWKQHKTSPDSAASKTELSFTLKDINLKGIHFSYTQGKNDAAIELNNLFADAALAQTPEGSSIQIKSNALLKLLSFGGVNYYKNKDLALSSSFLLSKAKLQLINKPTELLLDGAAFTLEGAYSFSPKYIDLKALSKGADISHLISLFPAGLSKDFRKYKSKGNISFEALCKGSLEKGRVPLFAAKFSAKNASVFHPDVKEAINNLYFQGSFTNKNAEGTEQLIIKDLKGMLAGKNFEGNFTLRNFKKPYCEADFSGILSLARLHQLFKIPTLKTLTGNAELNASLKGYLQEWKNSKANNNFKLSGEIAFTEVSFQFENNPLPFKNFQGTLLFDSKQIALSNFKGFIGRSDIALNAQLNNLLPKILGNTKEELKLELNLNSKFIDANELVAINANSKAQQQKGVLFVPEGIALRIGMQAETIHYKKLKAQQVSGTVLLKPKGVKIEDASLQLAGGKLALNILTDASNSNEVKASLRIDAQNLLMDSVFTVFENFGQAYLTNKNVKGRVNVKMESSFTANSNFEPYMPSLKAFIKAAIKQGELINFEPIQAIGKYFRRSKGSFNRLVFSNLENSIIISESIITIPEFTIRANDLELGIQGTHGFNQQMDYRVRIPIRNFRLPDKDEAFGEIAQDESSDGNLFLKLQGKEGNISVTLDKQATRKRFIDNLKKEKEEFLDLWRKPKPDSKNPAPEKEAQQQQQKPANDEEFFDF